MKVYYINDFANTVISLEELNKLSKNTKVVVTKEDREITYTVDDIYKCRDWKAYTQEDSSLTLEDIRTLKNKVDRYSTLYKKLQKEEENLLNIYVEEVSIEAERSLF